VILNGDLVNAVPFSAEVIDRVRALDWLVVRGNHEFYFLDFGTDRAVAGSEDPRRWGQLHWLVERISPEQGAYLASLPDERTLYFPGTAPLRVAHGVPGRNRVGFYNEQSAEQITREIEHVQEQTLISAHTHVQIDRHVRKIIDLPHALQADPHVDAHVGDHGVMHRHWHLINPGSVGLPLDRDPRAQFALIESVPEQVEAGGWSATHYRAQYDRRPALASYWESGMMDAGGIISNLFYWELVTAEAEIVFFYRWAYENGHNPDDDVDIAFREYVLRTGRDKYVNDLDPLGTSHSWIGG